MSIHKINVIAALAVAVLFAAGGCAERGTVPTGPSPAVGTGSVQGRVLVDGAPANDAAVLRLTPQQGGGRVTRTNAAGRFVFPAVPEGSATVRIVPPAGYRMAEGASTLATVQVRDADSTEVRFELEPNSSGPIDSTGVGDPWGWLEVRAELGGQPLAGLLVAAIAEDGERFEQMTDTQGVALFPLGTGVYTVAAQPSLYGEETPWLRILSIEPERVTVEKTPAVATSVVRVGYEPGVPVPDGEVAVWVGAVVDSTYGQSPTLPEPGPVPVTVYRAGTQEVVAQGSTGEAGQVRFAMAPGLYDVAIEVPEGFTLPEWEVNPATGIPVSPRNTSWVGFSLVPNP